MRVQSLGAIILPPSSARLARFEVTPNNPEWGAVSADGNTISRLGGNYTHVNGSFLAALGKYGFDELLNPSSSFVRTSDVDILKPIDGETEVWAAGVTYKRSQVARMEESVTSASNYDKVYTAPRPEVFFKANPRRVANPGDPVRVRSDSNWSVPEPEFTLGIIPTDLDGSKGKIALFTIGNDMSARDIEGENPLYLPQAKLHNECCALGPVVIAMAVEETALEMFARSQSIEMEIARGGSNIFKGQTSFDQIIRTLPGLREALFYDNSLPGGAYLLTGTGIVPPDGFSLENGDAITMRIPGLVELTNPVVKDPPRPPVDPKTLFKPGAFDK